MRILMDKKGLSVLEVLCITVISATLMFMAVAGLMKLDDYLDNGNDSLMVNSAESVARVNLTADGCVVNGCSGGSECTHVDSGGSSIGYYEPVTHHIVASKPSGYNEFRIMRIDGKYYTGAESTMVICVRGRGDSVKLKWVKGDND